MPFDKSLLPDAAIYFEAQGLILKGPRSSKWKTTSCVFHGGSDSMRINILHGHWICMACGIKGGDVLGYHMKSQGLEFKEAAKSLGVWTDTGKATSFCKPTPLPARAALEILQQEANLTAIAAANLAKGVALSDLDRERLLKAVGRINWLVEVFHG